MTTERLDSKERYYITEYARGRWNVIGPSGLPLYNYAPHGNDTPIVFKDQESAIACADRCNIDDDGKEI